MQPKQELKSNFGMILVLTYTRKWHVYISTEFVFIE